MQYKVGAKSFTRYRVKKDNEKKEEPKKEEEKKEEEKKEEQIEEVEDNEEEEEEEEFYENPDATIKMPKGFPEEYKKIFLASDDATREAYLEQFGLMIAEGEDINDNLIDDTEENYIPTKEQLEEYGRMYDNNFGVNDNFIKYLHDFEKIETIEMKRFSEYCETIPKVEGRQKISREEAARIMSEINEESGKRVSSYMSVQDAALRAKSESVDDIKNFIYEFINDQILKDLKKEKEGK